MPSPKSNLCRLPAATVRCRQTGCVLGADGIVTTLQPTLDAQENAALQRSVGILNEAAASLDL